MIEKEYLIELQVNLMAINPEEYTPKLLAQKIYETSKREVSTLPEHEEEKNLKRNFSTNDSLCSRPRTSS